MKSLLIKFQSQKSSNLSLKSVTSDSSPRSIFANKQTSYKFIDSTNHRSASYTSCKWLASSPFASVSGACYRPEQTVISFLEPFLTGDRTVNGICSMIILFGISNPFNPSERPYCSISACTHANTSSLCIKDSTPGNFFERKQSGIFQRKNALGGLSILAIMFLLKGPSKLSDQGRKI